MPDITDPQVVRFANEKARLLADAAEQLYQTSLRYQQEWDALIALGETIPNTTDVVIDGSSVDGRKTVTGARLNGLKALADAMKIWFETGSPTRIAQIQQISVNGQARF